MVKPKNLSMIIWLIVPLCLLFTFSAFSQEADVSEQSTIIAPCVDCHLCESPTTKEPCLKSCLRTEKKLKKNGKNHGPELRILDQLEDMYKPVSFNHKLHAEMVGMGNGCPTCHHYSPVDKIPPCRECHEKVPSNQNLQKPGLKGAYHRQCMGCHREWSHDTKCAVCHELCDDLQLNLSHQDSTDIIGISHPVITIPAKKLYRTHYDKGEKVTFYHNEHIDRFDLKCVDCHKRENCGYCHYLEKTIHIKKSEEEVHAICNDCHLNDKCNKCHDTQEKPPFNHNSTGWKLSKYHQYLECRNCHPTGKRITSMNGNCNSCHAGWSQDNFRHDVTGLHLDEIHQSFDCEDCHIDYKYHNKPLCDNCHDDNRKVKENPPGTYIK